MTEPLNENFDFDVVQKDRYEKAKFCDEAFRTVMLSAIERGRERATIGIKTTSDQIDNVVRARFASFRFGSIASAINDL